MTDARSDAATQPPIRSQVRTAVARAWARAFMSGTLPRIERDQPVPAVEVERPANPEHGDLATNLAMKLAKMSLSANVNTSAINGSGAAIDRVA